MIAINKKDIQALSLLFIPLTVFTVILATTQPVYVTGINFRAYLNQSVSEAELANMSETLELEGWQIKYPASYSGDTTYSNDTLLIKTARLEIYLIAGDNTYFAGDGSYVLDILRGKGMNLMEQKPVINRALENISQTLSLNYSEEKLSIDDNDFVLMPYQIEQMLYALCLGNTLGGLTVFFYHKSDMWWLILKNQKVLDSFILLTISFFPTWFLYRTVRGDFKMNALCNTLLLLFVVVFALAVYSLRGTKKEMEMAAKQRGEDK